MEFTLEQLKSMAYDRIVIIQNAQAELEQINKAIKDFGIKQPEEPTEEPVKKAKKDK
jgi:putative cell wall-binding protein